jgi:hypothetical protein
MFIAIILTMCAISCLVWAITYKKKLAIAELEQKGLEKEYSPVKQQKDELSSTTSNYQLLQKEYNDSLKKLKKNEERLSKYNLGVGSMDSTAYQRSASNVNLDDLIDSLDLVKKQIKAMVKNKDACICGMEWVVNNKRSEGKKLTNREIKLRIRCLDNAVKAAIAVVDWHNINRLTELLKDTFNEINSSAHVIQAYIKRPYLELKIKELKLSYEVRALKSELKEQEREEKKLEREAIREEARIDAAAKKAIAEREKMEKLVAQELSKLESCSEEQIQLLEQHKLQLEILKGKEKRAISMAQQTRAGFVYIISNEMSFGRGICKIGMTRRVDPQDRVKELGDASVPDTFDVHAFIYSEDAPTLEKYLHNCFVDERVNLVNSRKEFFIVEPDNVLKKLEAYEGEIDISLFSVEPKAKSWKREDSLDKVDLCTAEPEILVAPVKDKEDPVISVKNTEGSLKSYHVLSDEDKLEITQRLGKLKTHIKEINFISVSNCESLTTGEQEVSTTQTLSGLIDKLNRLEFQEYVPDVEDLTELKKLMDGVADAEIKALVIKEYPDDYLMQKSVYEDQLEAKLFMNDATDAEIQALAIKEWPDDYETQKSVYEDQLEAKLFMNDATDAEIQALAIKEWPGDYETQKSVYEDQLEAKLFMNDVTDAEIQALAIKEWPGDYETQKSVYEDQLEAKLFMNDATDAEIQALAIEEWPSDYSMQMHIYKEQRVG